MAGNSFQNQKRIKALKSLVKQEKAEYFQKGKGELLEAAFSYKEPNFHKKQNLQDYDEKELKECRKNTKKNILDKFIETDLYKKEIDQTKDDAYWAEQDYRVRRYALEIPVKVSIIAVGIIGGVLLKDYFEGIGWSSLAGGLVAGAAVTLPLALLYYVAKIFIAPKTKSEAHAEVRKKEILHEIEGIMQENVCSPQKSLNKNETKDNSRLSERGEQDKSQALVNQILDLFRNGLFNAK